MNSQEFRLGMAGKTGTLVLFCLMHEDSLAIYLLEYGWKHVYIGRVYEWHAAGTCRAQVATSLFRTPFDFHEPFLPNYPEQQGGRDVSALSAAALLRLGRNVVDDMRRTRGTGRA